MSVRVSDAETGGQGMGPLEGDSEGAVAWQATVEANKTGGATREMANAAEEIAMAIIAEVQAALMGRSGGHLRDRTEPIHKLREPICCVELQ